MRAPRPISHNLQMAFSSSLVLVPPVLAPEPLGSTVVAMVELTNCCEMPEFDATYSTSMSVPLLTNPCVVPLLMSWDSSVAADDAVMLSARRRRALTLLPVAAGSR